MLKPNSLPQNIVDLLLARLSDEYTAFYFYRTASNWCQGKGYTKAAEFFKNESTDELSHAKGIEDFLTDWNVTVELPNIESSNLWDFINIVDIIEQAYNLEFNLYTAYNEISTDIFTSGDLATFDFVGKYRDIQRVSVAEYSDKLNLLEDVELDKMNILLLEKRLF